MRKFKLNETPNETTPSRPDVDFVNEAIWTCRNRVTGFLTRINGALAEILLKYPRDYELKGPYYWTAFDEVS